MSPLPNPIAMLASRPSMVAASTWRYGGGSIRATRQRAAFSGRDTARFSRIAAVTAQGALADSATAQGFSRHNTTASRHSGRQRSAIFQRRSHGGYAATLERTPEIRSAGGDATLRNTSRILVPIFVQSNASAMACPREMRSP